MRYDTGSLIVEGLMCDVYDISYDTGILVCI